MTPFLPPVERPRGLRMKLVYFVSRKMFGKVATPLSVGSARMPFAFLRFNLRIASLDRKLKLPHELVLVVRQHVTQLNGCGFCIDLQRWYVARKTPNTLARFDALTDHNNSPLFTAAERAALDYATELTTHKHVSPDTFAAAAEHFDEREICELVWLVASEHVYNLSNHGLNIGSDGFCSVSVGRRSPETSQSATDARRAVADRKAS